MKAKKTIFLVVISVVVAVASVAGSIFRENTLFSNTTNAATTTKYTTNGNLRTKYVTGDSPYQIHCTYGPEKLLWSILNPSDLPLEVSEVVTVSAQGSIDYAVPASYVSFSTAVNCSSSFIVSREIPAWSYYREYYKEETQDHRIKTEITIEQKQNGKWITISSAPTYATSHFYKKDFLFTGGRCYTYPH